jgi:hypothetical protein
MQSLLTFKEAVHTITTGLETVLFRLALRFWIATPQIKINTVCIDVLIHSIQAQFQVCLQFIFHTFIFQRLVELL